MNTYEKVQLDTDMPMKFSIIKIDKNKHRVIDKHWHRSIEILVPIKGRVYVWINGKTKVVNAGDFFIINSKEIHAAYGIKGEEYEGYLIQLSYEFLLKCYKDMDSIYFEQVKETNLKKEILNIIENIRRHYKGKDEYKKLIIEGMLLILIHILLCRQKKIKSNSKLVESDKNRDRIIEITEYIDKHYAESLSVEMIADNFNLSYGHFVRIFKDNLKITVKDYITNIRLNKCKEDLISTDYSIVQIALENGFPNIQSFYKEFHKVYNMTPAKFRKTSQINK